MASPNIFATVLFSVGPLPIGETVVTTWGVMLFLFLVSWLSTRRLSIEPGAWQVALEGIVGAIQDAIEAVLPEYCAKRAALYRFPMDLSGHRQFDRYHSGPA